MHFKSYLKPNTHSHFALTMQQTFSPLAEKFSSHELCSHCYCTLMFAGVKPNTYQHCLFTNYTANRSSQLLQNPAHMNYALPAAIYIFALFEYCARHIVCILIIMTNSLSTFWLLQYNCCKHSGYCFISNCILRVSDQNGIPQAWHIVEIHHSSRELSICRFLLSRWH